MKLKMVYRTDQVQKDDRSTEMATTDNVVPRDRGNGKSEFQHSRRAVVGKSVLYDKNIIKYNSDNTVVLLLFASKRNAGLHIDSRCRDR